MMRVAKCEYAVFTNGNVWLYKTQFTQFCSCGLAQKKLLEGKCNFERHDNLQRSLPQGPQGMFPSSLCLNFAFIFETKGLWV